MDGLLAKEVISGRGLGQCAYKFIDDDSLQ